MSELGIIERTDSTAQGMTRRTRRSKNKKGQPVIKSLRMHDSDASTYCGNTVLGTSGIVCCLILTTVCHEVLIPMMIPYFTDKENETQRSLSPNHPHL